MYYLNGKVYTYDDVVRRNDPNEEILRQNMSSNNNWVIVITTNGHKSARFFNENDVVVDSQGKIVDKGLHYKAYKEEKDNQKLEQ